MRRKFTNDKDNLTEGVIPGRQKGDIDYNDTTYFTNCKCGQYPLDGSFLNPEGEYRWKAIHTIERILRQKPHVKSILDAGSGPCHLSYWVNKKKLPIRVVNYDISESLFKYLRENKLLFGEVVIGDVCDIRKKIKDPFDAIVYSDILEHIDPMDALNILKYSHSILNDEGLLFINIPNRNSWSNASYRSPAHIWLPSIGEIKDFLGKAGFNSFSITTRGFPGSKLYTKITRKDITFPSFGRSIIVFARKYA